MNTLTILFVVLLCLVIVNARHFEERVDDLSAENDQSANVRRQREHGAGPLRRRHRRWQNYGYEYNPPPNPYYPDRREYDRNQDLLTQIYRILDEISTQLRRPPPPPLPPQPIYVPYPVLYPAPQLCSCPTNQKKPNITSRFPEMDDPNQNWGFVLNNENTNDDDGTDGERPISFDKIKPIRPTLVPAPPVENGSVQSGRQATTQAPVFGPEASQAKLPGLCSAAILSCCGVSVEQQQRQCFVRMGCSTNFLNGEACSTSSIAAALDSFKNAYQPLN